MKKTSGWLLNNDEPKPAKVPAPVELKENQKDNAFWVDSYYFMNGKPWTQFKGEVVFFIWDDKTKKYKINADCFYGQTFTTLKDAIQFINTEYKKWVFDYRKLYDWKHYKHTPKIENIKIQISKSEGFFSPRGEVIQLAV